MLWTRPNSLRSFHFLAIVFALSAYSIESVVAQAATVTSFPIQTIEHIFSFGDSYTTTGYNPAAGVTQVNTFVTTSGGPTWIQYVANGSTTTSSTYYNFAQLGATISNSVVYSNGAGDFSTQVVNFLEYFNSTGSEVQWDSDTSLFTVWFGNDDMYNICSAGVDFLTLQPMLITSLDMQIKNLYAAGARKFLIADLPALSRAPVANVFGTSGIETAVAYWNSRLAIYLDLFSQQYPDATAWALKTTNIFNAIMVNPTSYGIQNILTSCNSYSFAGFTPNVYDAACVYPLSQYFWRDYWHPTWTVHQVIGTAALSLLAKNTSTIPTGTYPISGGAATPTTVPIGSTQQVSIPLSSVPTTTDTGGVATLTGQNTAVVSIPTTATVVANITTTSQDTETTAQQASTSQQSSTSSSASTSTASRSSDTKGSLSVGFSGSAAASLSRPWVMLVTCLTVGVTILTLS
ncbi:hypothetical protein T439DRAFT_329128 [Meredithblackwellia eburnea MCA 4105]